MQENHPTPKSYNFFFMTNSITNQVTFKKIITFLFLTFGFSWAFFLYGIFNLKGNFSIQNESMALPILIGSFGPTFGALITHLIFNGFSKTLSWLKKSLSFRMGFKLFFYMIFALTTLVFLAKSLTSGYGIEWYNIVFTMILLMPINWLGGILNGSGPLGEELGWRGFLGPIIFDKFSTFKASIIMGVIWSAWHLPLFIFEDWRGGTNIFVFAIFYTISTIILSWLFQLVYTASKQKVSAAIIMHCVINTASHYGDSPRWWLNSIIIKEFDFILYIVCYGLFGIGLWYLINKTKFFEWKVKKINDK
jgi:uncharacterized protein